MHVREQLLECGFKPHYRGYSYLIRAVELMVENPDLVSNIYAIIANEMGVTAGSVERNLRTVISAWWERGGRAFGMQQRPYAGELIAVLAERMRIGL